MSNSQPFFDFAPIWQSRVLLIEGFGIAMFSAVAGIILAIILGLIIALMRLSRFKILRGFAFIYTQLFRGVPLYVLILWIYFGLVYAVGIDIPRIPSGIIALALLNSGYLSETFRSGILAVSNGQREAGQALGLKGWQVARYIILPQAGRIVIPPTGNQFIDAIKDSAILSIIGVPELMKVAQEQANLFYRPFEFYTVAGLLYLVAVLIVSRGITALENRLAKYSRKSGSSENSVVTTATTDASH
ncbi:MAG: amino acid ABC transporter permease [Actinomycetota bacterium]|nr:amino acid ABC transporter permease [Actinomycetota bacterium]